MANNTILMRARARFTLERIAGGVITPGHLCLIDSSDEAVVNGAAADVDPEKLWALENQASGLGISDDYASGDRVVMQQSLPGELIYAFLDNGENVAIGASLESAGNGNLQARTTGDVVAFAEEAVNATGGTARIKVRAA